VLGSSKATNVACLAVFDPDTNSALSRQLEIRIFVFKSTSASEWLMYSMHHQKLKSKTYDTRHTL
jgi:hypothetical protein